MLIRESISGYRHIDVGNIKLIFSMVCRDELFRDVYFAASSLYHVERGAAVMRCGDEELRVEEGEVVLIKQHTVLDIRKLKGKGGEDFRSIIFFLLPDFVEDFLKGKRVDVSTDMDDRNIIRSGDSEPFAALCRSLIPLFDGPVHTTSAIREKTCEALTLLSQQNMEFLRFLSGHSRPINIDLYEFMLHHAVSSYSVDELARLSGRSISTFKRDFRRIFNTTPHQWILRQKIDYAERLLTESGMKSAEIFHMLGFNELSHFSAAFKKLKGISPAQAGASRGE